MKIKLAALAVVIFAAYVGFSADSLKSASKEETTPALKSVSCPPECGFTCKSHDEKELIEIVKTHAKTMHRIDLTDDQIKSMMKAESTPFAAKK